MSSTWMNDAGASQNGLPPNMNFNMNIDMSGFPPMNNLPPSSNSAMMDPSLLGSPAGFNNSQFTPNQMPSQLSPLSNPNMRTPSFPYQTTPQQQQLQQQQQQQQQQPLPPNSSYQTNQVIPSKRPRPLEDTQVLAGSPHQSTTPLPPSRSQTPSSFAQFPQGGHPVSHQPSPGAPGPSSEQSTPQPNQFMSHQHGFPPNLMPVMSGSPVPQSPTSNSQQRQQMMLQQQQHQQQQQHAFNQNRQPIGSQPSSHPPMASSTTAASPGLPNASTPGSVSAQLPFNNTPQHMAAYQNQMQYMQNPPGGAPMNQIPQGPNVKAIPNGTSPQNQSPAGSLTPQQQQQLQIQMQQQQQVPTQAARPPMRIDPEVFMRNLTQFMTSRQLRFDPKPNISGRPIPLAALFQVVQSRGGYKNVMMQNLWPHITIAMGINPTQMPMAPGFIKQIYEQSLVRFEEAWMAQQNQRRMGQPNQTQPPQQANLSSQPQQQLPPTSGALPPSQQQQQQPIGTPSSLARSLPGNGMFPGSETPQPGSLTPNSNKRKASMSHSVTDGDDSLLSANGVMPSPNMKQQQKQQQKQTKQPPKQTKQPQKQTPKLQRPQQPSPHNSVVPSQLIIPSSNDIPNGDASTHLIRGTSSSEGPLSHGVQYQPQSTSPFPPPKPIISFDEYVPLVQELDTWGGVNLKIAHNIGHELERVRPDIPPVQELGHIDVDALTRSLQSGIHSEVRMALDTLAMVTLSTHQFHAIQVQYVPELLEALVDCAEDQIDRLIAHSIQFADETELVPYESVVRACHSEGLQVRHNPPLGTDAYELDRSVDRLLCVMTILRNLSFPPFEQASNAVLLADDAVIEVICRVIRCMGTRTLFFRTNLNALDFMKDLIVFLSNIASSIAVANPDQILQLVKFISAFSPMPEPVVEDDTTINFTPYDPSIHPYLPHAVDTLAKLLARDDPNRGYFKSVVDSHLQESPPSFTNLNQLFALSIAPLPVQLRDARSGYLSSIVELRKPMLMQGLLAAEIMVTLFPGRELPLASYWLSPTNGLAQNLWSIVHILTRQYENSLVLFRKQSLMHNNGKIMKNGPLPPLSSGGAVSVDDSLVYLVVLCISVLRLLIQKSVDPSEVKPKLPAGVLPPEEMLMTLALTMSSPEWSKEGVVQTLWTLASLASSPE